MVEKKNKVSNLETDIMFVELSIMGNPATIEHQSHKTQALQEHITIKSPKNNSISHRKIKVNLATRLFHFTTFLCKN